MEYTQSLAQGLEILLEYDASTSFLTAAEICKKKGYSLSKTYRIIRTLAKHGFLEEEKGMARYSLGLNALRLGLLAQKKFTLAVVAKPLMEELCAVSKESVVLTVVNGTKATCIASFESSEPIHSSTFQAGESRYLHAGASSKILMAYIHETEWGRVIESEGLKRFTSRTITDAQALKEHLREIRKKGYAISYQEVYDDVGAVGAPILDENGNLIGGLSIVGPVYRLSKKKLSSLVGLAQDYARKISKRMGCVDPAGGSVNDNMAAPSKEIRGMKPRASPARDRRSNRVSRSTNKSGTL